MTSTQSLFKASPDKVRVALRSIDDSTLLRQAHDLTRSIHGHIVTYSPNVFIPPTKLCRDVCHYCTFAETSRHVASPYLTTDEVLTIARQGEHLGCTEALFTLGDRPETKYRAARDALAALGHVIPNVQASRVKLALKVGANDLGGVLMDESITRSAGGVHGQCSGPDQMRSVAQSASQRVRQRTTLYGVVDSFNARELV